MMMASCFSVMQMATPTDASGGADPFEVIRAHQVRSLALLIGMRNVYVVLSNHEDNNFATYKQIRYYGP
jgi:hypothetical protein